MSAGGEQIALRPPTGLVVRLLMLIVLVTIGAIVLRLSARPDTAAATTLQLGFLLLASYVAGQVARAAALPRITGYLALGLAIGPDALGILRPESLQRLRAIDEIALSLIALSAGGELRLAAIRRRTRSIVAITGAQLLIVFLLVGGVVIAARHLFIFLEGRPLRAAAAVAVLFGLAAVAKSPATTIAVITEEKARGVLTDTVLAVTVIKDVLILVLTALLIPLAAAIARPEGTLALGALEEVAIVIIASVATGAAFGLGIGRFLAWFRGSEVLLVLAAAFLSVELASTIGLEYILLSMVAGFVVQNFSEEGPRLIGALEANSLPVFALFFALAGAGLDLHTLAHVWKLASVVLIARFAALFLSTYVGARLAGDGPVIRQYAWTGFVAMAGVTLGIANLIRDRFPELGPQIATVIVAMIAVNQLVGPPIFRYALLRAGESRRG